MSYSRTSAVKIPPGISIPRETLRRSSFWQNLFGKKLSYNAMVQVHNSVVYGELSESLIDKIETVYGCDVRSEFQDHWVELLEEIVRQLARDGDVDQYEQGFLREYLRCFRIDRQIATPAYRRGMRRAFVGVVADVIKDGSLDSADQRDLQSIAVRFGIEDADATLTIAECVNQHAQEILVDILRDNEISDTEWAHYQWVCQSLALSDAPDANAHDVQVARERWRIKQGDLTPIAITDVKLSQAEKGYFIGSAQWWENRRVRSGGITTDEPQLIVSGRFDPNEQASSLDGGDRRQQSHQVDVGARGPNPRLKSHRT